jgi:ATP-dependent helicase/nuclease subunit B
MHQLIGAKNSTDKLKLFSEFQPESGTWVVSDLQSKWHLQKQLLSQHGRLEERAVMRATELWRHLAFQLLPAVRILSHELAQTLFWDWIQPMKLPWARSPQSVSVLLNQMQMWMSVFSDPRHAEIMAQWFEANPESYVRWGHWFELCAEIWSRCEERGLVMMSWLPAVLLNQDLSQLQWSRELTFDLGSQISQVEGLLLRELARHFTVRVIYPEAPWASLMRGALRPYEELMQESYAGDPQWQPPVINELRMRRYSTSLAEVKDAVHLVRQWLEQGVPPLQIALVAPDIEGYWPVLQMYFEQEGVPVNKALSAKLGSFSEMAHWVASLRTAFQRITSSDLEMHFFAAPERPKLAFDEFRVLFSHVYDARDLERASRYFQEAPGKPLETMTLLEFLPLSLQHWSAANSSERLLQLLQILSQEVPRDLELSPHQWLSYVEGLLARRDVNLGAASDAGVWCVSVSSSEWLESSHAIFLNLSEGALRRVDSSPVSMGETQKIFTDTGFAIGTTDRQELEFELLWFLQRQRQELQLNFSATDFLGSVQTPSRFWMWAGFINDQLLTEAQAPGRTRWDQIQRLDLDGLARLRGYSEAHQLGLQVGLQRDLTNQPTTWGTPREVRVSASSLERFWHCPFTFAAARLLKLNDNPVLDLDLDRRTRGQLLHALAEELSQEPLRWEWSDVELHTLIDEVRARQNILVADERLWPAVRAQHLRLARLFLQFEKQWRERFPQARTVGREVAFLCYWDMTQAAPSAEVSPVTLAGRLDRVDQDSQGRYALVDYKASSGGLTNWSSWIKNYDVQMALYAQLLEQGLVELPAAPVVAANYYVIKDSDRRKGYHVKDVGSELYSSEDKLYNFISIEQKQSMHQQLREQIQLALNQIIKGELNPQPREMGTCDSCSWRTLCRAPHLN